MSGGLILLEDLFKQIVGPFAATQVSLLISEPDNIEDRVHLLEKTFNTFPQFITPFRSLIKSLNTQEVEVPLEENIRFYTTKHTRIWLIVNMLNQILDVKELRLDDKTGRLPGKPSDLLKYATQSQYTFGEDSRYKDLVFAAGLLFDFLFYLQKTNLVNVGQTKFDEPIEQCFQKSLEQGTLTMKLARNKAKLTHEKVAPVVPYMRQLSQLALTLLRPSVAPEFYKTLFKGKYTESYRLHLEMQTFGVHTGMIASYLAQSIPQFGGLGAAMSVWGFPYLDYTEEQHEIHDLSGMGLLGVTLHERIRPVTVPNQTRAGSIIPELNYLDFTITKEAKGEAKV